MGNKTIKFKDGSIYQGEIEEDVPFGYGVYKHKKGDIVASNFIKGLPNGIGYIKTTNDESYIGKWSGGFKHGDFYKYPENLFSSSVKEFIDHTFGHFYEIMYCFLKNTDNTPITFYYNHLVNNENDEHKINKKINFYKEHINIFKYFNSDKSYGYVNFDDWGWNQVSVNDQKKLVLVSCYRSYLWGKDGFKLGETDRHEEDQSKEVALKGNGKIVYYNGFMYVGNLKENLPDGEGYFVDGKEHAIYKGTFENGKKNGEFKKYIIKYNDYTMEILNFEQDVLVNKQCETPIQKENKDNIVEVIKERKQETKKVDKTQLDEKKTNIALSFQKIEHLNNSSLYKTIVAHGFKVQTILHENEDLYVGTVLNNLPNGAGIYFHNNGDIYEGGFFMGLPTGYGQLAKKGMLIKGIFEEGILTDIYTESSLNSIVNGDFCTKTVEEVESITKVFDETNIDAKVLYNVPSKITYQNGIIEKPFYENEDKYCLYIGPLKNNKPHGFGIYYDTLQNFYEFSYYENGEINGPDLTVEDELVFRKYKEGKIESQRVTISCEGIDNNQFDFTKYKPIVNTNEAQEEQTNKITIGTMEYADGLYKGEIKNNKPNGQGTFTFKSGEEYKGEWKDGIRHGKGEYVFSDGDIYTGEWKENEMYGIGTLKLQNWGSYTGEFKNGTQHGEGVMIYKSGTKYSGEWKDGIRHGKGEYIFADGSVYTGEWKNGSCHGEGTLIYNNCDKYSGEWKNGSRHGEGVLQYHNGDHYSGEWKNDKKHGKGFFCDSANNTNYIGTWEDNEMHGKFVVEEYGRGRSEKSTTYYNCGKKSNRPPNESSNVSDRMEYGVINYTNAKYEGTIKDDEPHGKGTITYDSGEYYEGEWFYGKKSGYGKYYDKNGSLDYEGEWADDKQNGEGVEYTGSGRYIGSFVDGQRHGFGKFITNDVVDASIWIGSWENGRKASGHWEDYDMYVEVHR